MLYKTAARLGINGAELDQNPPYVVRWMLTGPEEEAAEDGTYTGPESADSVAATALARGAA